jgi:hypothetical protein
MRTSCAQNEPAAFVGCSSPARHRRFLPSFFPRQYAAPWGSPARRMPRRRFSNPLGDIPLEWPLTTADMSCWLQSQAWRRPLAGSFGTRPSTSRSRWQGFAQTSHPFVQLQRQRSGILWVWGEQGGRQRRKLSSFFDPTGHGVTKDAKGAPQAAEEARVLERHAGFPRGEFLERRRESDSHGFAIRRHDSQRAVCHGRHDHGAPERHVLKSRAVKDDRHH